MKAILLGLLLLVIASCGLPSKMPEGKNVQINIQIDESVSSVDQWVYLHHYNHNEHIIDDSVFVKSGQKETTLSADIREESRFMILFSKSGPIDWPLYLNPNSYVKASVSNANGITASTNVTGAATMNEMQEKKEHTEQLNKLKFFLHDSLSAPGLTPQRKQSLTSRLARVDHQLDSLEMNLVTSSYSLHNTLDALRYFKYKVSKDSLKNLCNLALKRFPDNMEITSMRRSLRVVYPEASESSRKVEERIGSIIDARLKTAGIEWKKEE